MRLFVVTLPNGLVLKISFFAESSQTVPFFIILMSHDTSNFLLRWGLKPHLSKKLLFENICTEGLLQVLDYYTFFKVIG